MIKSRRNDPTLNNYNIYLKTNINIEFSKYLLRKMSSPFNPNFYYRKQQQSPPHDITPSFPRSPPAHLNVYPNTPQQYHKRSSKQIFFGNTEQQLNQNSTPNSNSGNKFPTMQDIQNSLSQVLKQANQQTHNNKVQSQIPVFSIRQKVKASEDQGSEIKTSSIRNYSKIEERMRNKYRSSTNSKINSIEKVGMDNMNRELAKTSDQYQFHTITNKTGKVNNFYSTSQQYNLQNKFKSIEESPYSAIHIPLQHVPEKQKNSFNYPKNTRHNPVEIQENIYIHDTLIKPKFGFKTADNTRNLDQDSNRDDQNEVISFESSNNSLRNSVRSSKSASNFGDILKMEDKKYNMKVKKVGDMDEYMISKNDRKEEKINKKLQEIKKSNEVYDQKIRQKERQIEIIKKRMEKEEKQLQTYQSKIKQAFQNIQENPDSLLISSRNYEVSNSQIEARIKNKTVVTCNFNGFSKKLCKQILYGKCMILQTDLIQVGFDNRSKNGLIELYFIIKENLQQMQCYLENIVENGYTLQDDFNMQINNIAKGKKIKTKLTVNYLGTLNDNAGFMELKIILTMKNNMKFNESTILPFCLYRNFIEEMPNQTDNNPKIGSIASYKAKQTQKSPLNPNYNYYLVTQFKNSCDELIKNPKSYLQTLFKNGKWIEQNIFHIDLLFKGFQPKPLNILINCRNFAIEMIDLKNIDVVITVGNFLAKIK